VAIRRAFFGREGQELGDIHAADSSVRMGERKQGFSLLGRSIA